MDKITALTSNKIWLAPLAGYTDQPFRRICKEWGADVVVSEMVSADGVLHKQKRTLEYLDFTEQEKPFGIQLFGSNPEVLAKAAETALSYNPDFIDLNMGCPAKKVTKRGAGGALMADLSKAVQIVRSVKSVLASVIPLTVKFRSGTDASSLNFLDFGAALQDAGANIVTLHPRTVKQAFTGLSNWTHIRELKNKLSIPVIGNGDIKSAEDGIRMFQQTGCDSIMIGRGSLGHPWLFTQLRNKLSGSPDMEISLEQRLNTLLRHIDYALQTKPERIVVREIRAHLCFYTKGLSGGAKLRDAINHADTVHILKKILTEAFGE